jgi:phage shock protein C
MTDIAAAQPASPEWRNLFGVCAAIGEDIGFDPLWLRIAFAVPLIWRPEIVLSAYVAAGLVVLASRLAYPKRKVTVAAAEPVTFVARPAPEPLPLAA